MMRILTIDIGTSSMRGILFNKEGKSLNKWQYNYVPEFPDNEKVEQDASTWSKCLYGILEHVSSLMTTEDIQVEAIVLTAQRSSVIPVDQSGQPLSKAIMWQDRRTMAICDEMKVHNPLVHQKTGLKISPVFSAAKMLWFKKHQPSIYNQTYKMMGIQDYLLMLLTGKFITDQSLASRTNLLNLHTRDWDPALIQLFGIERDKLCDLVVPGSICGHLQTTIADKTGLPSGIPIISAGGDQQCAALGLGVIEEGSLEVNTGTGGYVIGASKKPVIDDKMNVFCNISAIPNAYITEASILTSGTIYRWFNENFYPSDDGSYDQINADVSNTPAGSKGLILMPHLKGRGAPYWNPLAKGLFYNLSLTTTKGDMARAILEGIVTEVKTNMDLIEALTTTTQHISVAGGLTNFCVYNQIQADTFDKEVTCYASGEATALGAFISAAVTLGYYSNYQKAFNHTITHYAPRSYKPNPQNTQVYHHISETKESLYHTLY